jgi:hypothetical protein
MLNDVIQVLIDNTELIRDMHMKMAGEVIALAPKCDEVASGDWTVEQAERIMLEQRLKDWYGDMIDDVYITCQGYAPRIQRGRTNDEDNYVTEYKFRDSLIKSLITHGFGHIKFFELARQLLADYRERNPT